MQSVLLLKICLPSTKMKSFFDIKVGARERLRFKECSAPQTIHYFSFSLEPGQADGAGESAKKQQAQLGQCNCKCGKYGM